MFMQEIPPNEVIVIGAEKNGYLGETNLGHEGFGYGTINDKGELSTSSNLMG